MRHDPARRERLTVIDALPVLRRDLSGHLGEMTAAERAILNGLKPKLIELLDGQGVTVAWIVERSGVGTRHCITYLKELGAKKPGGAVMWRRPRIPSAHFGWNG